MRFSQSDTAYGAEMNKVSRAVLLDSLNRHIPEIADHIAGAVLSAIPAYADVEDDLRITTPIAVESFIQHSQGQRRELNPLVIDYARRRARQGFDSGSIAHSWRIFAHELWHWLITKCSAEFDLQGTGLDVWNEFLDVYERYVGAIMDAFFETQSELSASELSRRRATLDSLLGGGSPDQNSKILGMMGIRSSRIRIAVCSVTGNGPADPAEPSFRFDPLLREIRTHVHRLPWTVANGLLILCLPYDERIDGRLDRLHDHLEPTMRVGLSRPWPVTESLAVPHRQARLALRGTDATTRIVDFGKLSLVQVAALQADLHAEDVPEALQILFAEDARSGREWVRTAEALLQAEGSIAGAAAALQVHTNTIYYRIAAARGATGLDLRNPSVLADVQYLQAARTFGTCTGANRPDAR